VSGTTSVVPLMQINREGFSPEGMSAAELPTVLPPVRLRQQTLARSQVSSRLGHWSEPAVALAQAGSMCLHASISSKQRLQTRTLSTQQYNKSHAHLLHQEPSGC